jgi:Cu-Zn family superoxide dismutase
MKRFFLVLPLAAGLFTAPVRADHTVTMQLADEQGAGRTIGSIVITESRYGVVFTPELSGLQPGVYGFHVHEKPSCAPAEKDGKMVPALGAGPHYDPTGSKKHGTPWGDGHLGDLPALAVSANGNAVNPVLAPRLKLADLKGRSLMIHAGGDNHADHPAPLGGGGARMACGVIQ